MEKKEENKEKCDIQKMFQEELERQLPPDEGLKYAFTQLYTLLLSM